MTVTTFCTMQRTLGHKEDVTFNRLLGKPDSSHVHYAGMIFYRKDLEEQVNQSVFPGLQGGPHNHTISGIAVALKMAATTEFKDYQHQIVSNCRAMADRSVGNIASRPDLVFGSLRCDIHTC